MDYNDMENYDKLWEKRLEIIGEDKKFIKQYQDSKHTLDDKEKLIQQLKVNRLKYESLAGLYTTKKN